MLFLILGPSGVGKGTQIELLKKRHPEFVFPKSITTRKMRPGEAEGLPYHFISDAQFDAYIANDEFLEWAEVHQAARYGTIRKPIEEAVATGKVVIKELDIQGLKKIEESISKQDSDFLRGKVQSIFIMPPDEATLITRITQRSVIKERELNARLESAKREMAEAGRCTYMINTSVEDSIEDVYKKLENILHPQHSS
jgi:guanylate kinase